MSESLQQFAVNFISFYCHQQKKASQFVWNTVNVSLSREVANELRDERKIVNRRTTLRSLTLALCVSLLIAIFLEVRKASYL